MKRTYTVSTLFAVTTIVAMAFVAVNSPLPAFAAGWNFTVPAQEIKPQNGVFTFPASQFEDGKARHYQFTNENGQKIRFFVVKSTDGIIRAAFDACERCWKAKKGYVQEGDSMTCINCGLKFRTDKVNVVTGGCNPSALKRTMKDGNVIIAVQDVTTGLGYFQ
jgi:uncharacterized membrane protein